MPRLAAMPAAAARLLLVCALLGAARPARADTYEEHLLLGHKLYNQGQYDLAAHE